MPGQSIRIPVELELKNVQSAINSLKSALGSVSKESGFYKTIEKDLDAVDKKFRELSAIASRPFGNTGAINSFENQFLKLGDRITDIGNAFQNLKFNDLDLSSIPGAKKDFEELRERVQEAQNALSSISTNKMKDMLAVDSSGLSQAFKELSNFNSNLLKGDSFDQTFSNLSAKAEELSGKISNTTAELERLKSANAQRSTQLGFLDEIKTKLSEFKPDELISFSGLAEKMKTSAANAGLTPEVLLNMLGLNKADLYSGTAEEIQKRLRNAISSKESSLSKGIAAATPQISSLDSTLQGLEKYVAAVIEARNQLNILRSDSGTQDQIAEAEKNLQNATNAFENFKQTLLQTGPAAKNIKNGLNSINSTMDSSPGKISAARAELDRLNDTANKLSQMKSRLAYFFSFYKVMGTIRKVVNEATTTIKELDSVMTEISVVTQMTQEDLWNQMDTYKAIANEYAVSIKGVYEVSQLYYQQGLQTAQVMDLTVETLKMAKIANIDYATATDYMTVAVRGFKMEMSDAQRVTDVYSALAATTASDTEELAVAMSKTASSAEAVGSSFESTSAMIATMVSVTREAPENIGSAMKSIISRYGEMTSDPTKLVDSEGEEMSLNRVDAALKSVGITLQNAQGEFKNFDDVILELAQKWDTIDTNAQRYIATIMAGNRQQSRFLALVGNYDQYAKALETANNAEDASALQVLKTMDSVESKITNVKTAWQSFYTSMSLEKMFKGTLDIITQIINNINKMSKFEAITTIFNIFTALKSLVMGIFSGIVSQFSQLKSFAQEAVTPLQETQKIQVDTSQPQTEFKNLHDLLVEALTQELKIDTTAANGLLEQLGIKAKSIMVPQGTNITQGATYNSQSETFLNAVQKFDWSTIKNLSGFMAAPDKKGYLSGGLTKNQEKALNEVFGEETGLRNAFIADFRNFVGNNKDLEEAFKKNDITTVVEAYKQHLTNMTEEERKAYLEKIKRNGENNKVNEEINKSGGNLATWLEQHAAGARVAATALQSVGAALTAWALTLKDSSESDREKTKLASGSGSLISGAGSAISGALLGVKAGIPGMIIGAIAAGAPAIISGLSQIIDGIKQTTVEKLANAENELKDLQDEETRKKAKSSSYVTALSELEDLKDAQYDSAEAAQAYKDKMNTLAESYPELVTSMDSAGNAIIDIQNLEQLLAEARLTTAQATSEALEKELQIAELDKKRYDEALEGINSVFSGASNYAIQNQSSRKASKDLSEFKNLEEVYDFGQIFSDYSGTTKILNDISNAAYKDGKAQTIELAGGQYKLPDVIRTLKQNDQGQFSFDKGFFKGQQELSLEDQNNLFSAIQSLGEINYNDIYTTPEEFEILNEELVKDSQYFEDYIAEKAQILKDSNIELKDLYLQDNYDNLMDRYEKALEDGKIEGQEEEALMTEIVDFYNIELPNALSAQIETATEAVKKSVSSLSKKYAQEELAELAINDSMYREIQEGYSGIFETIGGKLIENEFKTAKSEDSKLTLEDWKKTPEFNSVLDSLTNLDLSAYESIAEIWDNMGAYDPNELRNSLSALGLDSDITDLIIETYEESFDYSRELANKQIKNSHVAKNSRLLDLLTNEIDTYQAPAELMDDINNTVQSANKLYEQGLTARADSLITVAEGFYQAATDLDISEYQEARSIIDDLDLTNIEDLTDAKTALEAINTDGQYKALLASIEVAIANCSQNIDALANKIVNETINALEKISDVINGFSSGFEAKEALEAYKKLEGYKGLLEGKDFDYFFEYDEALGKWVYTSQGMSDVLAAQAKEIEVSNKAIDDLIVKSESEVHDALGVRNEEGYVKTAKDYYDEDTKTYDGAWTRLSAEDQAYREWARATQEEKGADAKVSKQAYIEYLRQQAADGDKAAQLMWEQMIYSLGDTLDLEKIVTGAMGEGRDKDRTLATVEEMIKANGKNLYDQFGNSIAERALLALEEGRFSDYELWTGDQLSSQEVADLVSSKATALNDAVLKAIEAPGTIIDEATYNILNEAGLASHIKWDKQGFGTVTEAAADYVAMIEAIASQGDMILEERNATLASLYEKSFDADKAKTLSDLSSKTSLGFSDLADLATTMGVTMDAFFNEDATDIILSGLDYNKFTGEFDVVDFDAYWETVTGSLDKNTAEYLEAYSEWVDDQISDSNAAAEAASDELDSLLDSQLKDKVNVTYLANALNKVGLSIENYGIQIEDGVGQITDTSRLYNLVEQITAMSEAGAIELEESVGELKDTLNELFDSWIDALSSGLSGELSNADAEALKQQFSFLSDMDFTETKNGLKLSRDAAFELYTELKKIDSIRAGLAFDALAESLAEAGSGYEDVASTMGTIAKLNKELANVPVDSSRREELERELAVAEEILRVRSQDPDSFNFMDKDLPTGMQGPENYWNSVGEAYKVMNESAKSGYMEIQDYYNIINHMSSMIEASGGNLEWMGMNAKNASERAAQLIELGMGALSNVDGEGVKINLESLGTNFDLGAEGMADGFAKGIKEVAKSQIEMLDGAIQLLETIVAMEEISNIDIDSDGIEIGELFTFNVPEEEADGWEDVEELLPKHKTFLENLQKRAKENEEVAKLLSDFTVNGMNLGHIFGNVLQGNYKTLEEAGISLDNYLALMQGIEQMVESGDYDLENLLTSVSVIFGQSFSDSNLILDLAGKTFVFTAQGETIEIDWSTDYNKEFLEGKSEEEVEKIKQSLKDWADGKQLEPLDLVTVYQVQGKVELAENGNYTFLGKEFTTPAQLASEIERYEAIKKALPEGQELKTSINDKGNITYTTTYGLNNKVELIADSNGEVTYSFGGQTGKTIDELIENYWSANEQKLLSYGTTKEQFIATFKGTVGIEAQPKLLTSEVTGKEGLTQEIIDEYGIDTSQVNTIAAAFETVDWSPIGTKIAEGISKALTTVGEGTDTETGILIGELTLKPKGLKVDTSEAGEPTLSSGEEALGNIPITSLTLTPETLYIDIVNKTPQLKEGQTVTIENIPSATGTVTGSITITNNGTWSAAEGQTSPEVTGYTSANGIVETVTINGSSFKVTPVVGAPTNLDGELNPVESGFVKVEGNYYSVDLSSGTQLNPGMDLSGVTAGSAQVNATKYTVTFTNANGTTSQSVIVQGEAQLNAVLQNATLGDNGGWILSGISAEADVSISAKSENALVNFFETLVNKLKNIEVTYQEPTLVGPGPDTSTTGYHVAGIDNNFGNLTTVGQYNKLDASAVEDITAQVDNGTFQNGTFTITEMRADGTQLTTTATLAELQADTINFSGATSTPTPSGPQGEKGRGGNSSGGNSNGGNALPTVLPPVDTSAMMASIQTAADSIGTRLGIAGQTGGAKAASAIQETLDGIKSKTVTINVDYPPTVSIGVKYSISVSVSSTGPGTVTGRIVGGSGISSFGKNSASGRANAKGKNGIALASGTKKTLMGELGPELVVSDGRYFLVGQNGAEFVDLADDAIVFNHLQTEKLIKHGHAGTGKPVTNETNAVSLATGNVSGPAMASASDALAQLRQIRAMWQAMLDASAKDLGSKAGSGGGGGGGGGGDGQDIKAVTGELERWYNLLRQIESLEQHITLEQAKRANMMSGYSYVDSLEKELEMLKEQQAAYGKLAELQKDYYDRRREDLLSTDYDKIFTYDEHGLMQYVDGENRGLDVLAKLNERDANGQLINHAVNAKTQLEYLSSIGFDTSKLVYNEDGTKGKTWEDFMENFWAGIDGWMEELDGLYDSYHEATTNFEESTEKMNEILQEYIDNQLSVEQKLMQAIQDREQAEIDRRQDEKDALEKSSQAYIDGLNEALSKEQNMYNQNQTNEETAKIQRRLAILQRSGGSASEIKSLQDQIDTRLQDSYFQAQQEQIDAIQQASDNQLEKLQTQIDLMTETLEYQKENGLLWQEVYVMMNEWTPEQMLQFIEEYTKSYQENSALQNQEDSEETLKELEIYTGKRDLDKRESAWNKYYSNAQYEDSIKEEYGSAAKEAFNTAFSTGGASAGEAAANKVFSDGVKTKEKEQQQQQQEPKEESKEIPSNLYTYQGGGWKFYTYKDPYGGGQGAVFHGNNASPVVQIDAFENNHALITGYDGEGDYFYQRWVKASYKGKNLWAQANQYKEGGLVDYTGPAWVDGTKSKPEAFLSASDTAMLKSKIFSNSDGSLKSLVAALERITNDTSHYSAETNSEQIVIQNAQVNIQPGVISNDYDARRAGEMALEEMVKIARKTTNRVVSR